MNPSFDGYGDDLRARAQALDDTAREIERAGNVGLPSVGKGVTVSRARSVLANTRQTADKVVDRLLLTAAVADKLQRAAADFRRDAPTLDEITAAEKAVADARERLKAAADTPGAAQAEKDLRAAQNHARDLRSRRKAAVETFERAVQKAVEKLKGTEQGGGTSRNIPGAPPADAPSKPPPTGKPAASPATRTVAGGTSPSLSGASNPAAADALNALMATQKQPGQAVAFLQPQQAAPSPARPSPVASLPAAARRLGDDKDRALGSRDLGLDGAPAAAVAALPLTNQAPDVAPNATTPAATSGSSANDLRTTTDVSGRSDAPRVRLSAGTATNVTSTAAGTNPANVAGQQVMPGTAPFMGTPGASGSRNGQKIVQHACSPEEAELQGMNTVNDAVRGGTILQRRHDSTGAA
jgi:hypothetical protein